MLISVDFEPIGKRIEVASNTTLLRAAQQAGLALSSACGGVGRGGQCRLEILAGSVSPPTVDEKYILTELELQHGQRLACHTHIQSNVKVHVPTSSLMTAQRLQLAGDQEAFTLDPLIHAYDLAVPSPTLHDPRSDLKRVTAALPLTPNTVDVKPEGNRDALPELTPWPPLLPREGEEEVDIVRNQKPPSLAKRRGLGDEFIVTINNSFA